MSTSATLLTGRYLITNHTLPLNDNEGSVSVSAVKPLDLQAWYLEDAPADMATAGKHCYVLRTDKGKFLALGHNSVIKRDPTSDNPNMAAIEGHSDIVFNSRDATTKFHADVAWVFVLEGISSSGTFKGNLISPDGRYKLGLYSNGGPTSPTATVYMSPQRIDQIRGTTWNLQFSRRE